MPRLLLFLLLLWLLAACGNKGDLYLPASTDEPDQTQPRKP